MEYKGLVLWIVHHANTLRIPPYDLSMSLRLLRYSLWEMIDSITTYRDDGYNDRIQDLEKRLDTILESSDQYCETLGLKRQ